MLNTSKKRLSSKLKLNHETVRVISAADLRAVAGGSYSFGNATGGSFTSAVDCCEK
jgi:hypothetical protein